MSECTSLEDFRKKQKNNLHMEGIGKDTTIYIPCPYCAEPEFIVTKMTESGPKWLAGAVCASCGRGMQSLVITDLNGGRKLEFVQIVGSAPPDWMAVKPRRVG